MFFRLSRFVPTLLFSFSFAVMVHGSDIPDISCEGEFTRFVETAGNHREDYVVKRGDQFKEFWPADRSPNYDQTFGSLYPRRFKKLNSLVRAENQNQPVSILDLFGSCTMIRPSSAYQMVGVRLTSQKHLSLPNGLPADNWHEVTGNIYRKETWEKLDALMKRVPIASFNFITVRPLGGLNGDSLSSFFYVQVLTTAYRYLSPRNGEMYFQIRNEEGFNEWLSLLRDAAVGFTTTEDKDGAARLVRRPDSPHQLPSFSPLP